MATALWERRTRRSSSQGLSLQARSDRQCAKNNKSLTSPGYPTPLIVPLRVVLAAMNRKVAQDEFHEEGSTLRRDARSLKVGTPEEDVLPHCSCPHTFRSLQPLSSHVATPHHPYCPPLLTRSNPSSPQLSSSRALRSLPFPSPSAYLLSSVSHSSQPLLFDRSIFYLAPGFSPLDTLLFPSLGDACPHWTVISSPSRSN